MMATIETISSKSAVNFVLTWRSRTHWHYLFKHTHVEIEHATDTLTLLLYITTSSHTVCILFSFHSFELPFVWACKFVGKTSFICHFQQLGLHGVNDTSLTQYYQTLAVQDEPYPLFGFFFQRPSLLWAMPLHPLDTICILDTWPPVILVAPRTYLTRVHRGIGKNCWIDLNCLTKLL